MFSFNLAPLAIFRQFKLGGNGLFVLAGPVINPFALAAGELNKSNLFSHVSRLAQNR